MGGAVYGVGLWDVMDSCPRKSRAKGHFDGIGLAARCGELTSLHPSDSLLHGL
jgi:hypothetical protein